MNAIRGCRRRLAAPLAGTRLCSQERCHRGTPEARGPGSMHAMRHSRLPASRPQWRPLLCKGPSQGCGLRDRHRPTVVRPGRDARQ